MLDSLFCSSDSMHIFDYLLFLLTSFAYNCICSGCKHYVLLRYTLFSIRHSFRSIRREKYSIIYRINIGKVKYKNSIEVRQSFTQLSDKFVFYAFLRYSNIPRKTTLIFTLQILYIASVLLHYIKLVLLQFNSFNF